ncbi:hypothetical protein LCGC14_0474160 [marine sediment metagenome]|uniref:Cell wall hydrolase SleB domain-containing protein n=1 Tax=marine sediment metagenome TaxID=412755 RepID=A0A0F9UY15_9ZZZZ
MKLVPLLVLVLLLAPYKLSGGLTEVKNIERKDDLFLLTATVAMEAEGESYKGKLGVAYVIMNRVQKRVPFKSMSDVVLDPYDFSAWNTKGGRQTSLDTIGQWAWQESEKAAHSAYYGIEKDPTHGATHYLNVRLTKLLRGGTLPGWLKVMKRTTKIGLHTFYKEVR